MVSKEKILSLLPVFRNERVLINKDQNVSDIIEQVLSAHKQNTKLYDEFAHLFNKSSLKKICDELYDFLKENVAYQEESEKEQTTKVPQGILTQAHGDCKHYSSFAGGVLDALNRQGKDIDWCYRFCSYRILEQTPHHVFICVFDDDGSEIWIDPVPGSEKLIPTWNLDKYTNDETMALYNVVGNSNENTVGYTISQQIAHAAARVSPVLIAGRAAFLQMVKWNVRAWAKNMDYLITTQSTKFTDPLGTKWYLLGGRWENLREAIEEGKDKKMIGGVGNVVGLTGVEITAMITAAAPVIIAITSVIKSAINKDDWDDTQGIPGMTTTYPGGTTTTPTTGTQLSNLFKNPVVLIGLAAGGYFLLSPKRKVNGISNETLLIGGIALLLLLSKKSNSVESAPLVEQPAIPTNENTEPLLIEEFPAGNDGVLYVPDENYAPITSEIVLDPERLDINEPTGNASDGGMYSSEFYGKEMEMYQY